MQNLQLLMIQYADDLNCTENLGDSIKSAQKVKKAKNYRGLNIGRHCKLLKKAKSKSQQ